MKLIPLFTLEAPLCAIEDPGARTTEVCPGCGRGKRTQTGILSAALVCGKRGIWLTDANAILADQELKGRLEVLSGIELHPARLRWEEDIPGRSEVQPAVVQLRARHAIHAAPQNVEEEDCVCGSVRRISFSPLVVLPPSEASAAAWYLAESPEALIISKPLRDLLATRDSDLEFAEVEYDTSRA